MARPSWTYDLSPGNRFRPPLSADEWNINNQFRKTNIAKISFLRSLFLPSFLPLSPLYIPFVKRSNPALSIDRSIDRSSLFIVSRCSFPSFFPPDDNTSFLFSFEISARWNIRPGGEPEIVSIVSPPENSRIPVPLFSSRNLNTARTSKRFALSANGNREKEKDIYIYIYISRAGISSITPLNYKLIIPRVMAPIFTSLFNLITATRSFETRPSPFLRFVPRLTVSISNFSLTRRILPSPLLSTFLPGNQPVFLLDVSFQPAKFYRLRSLNFSS